MQHQTVYEFMKQLAAPLAASHPEQYATLCRELDDLADSYAHMYRQLHAHLAAPTPQGEKQNANQ
jgi:hypothetical protein